ncbi:hypothetical protein [Nocardia transvalensis]|uniref:hypothetical protein n=1 Tax=Nocardia transvalensis TaxID=37333 RepID=UPI001894436D|nr:hypothetical protein [Nocardia transvalensis]MBF6331733.1 hypothetical protein [Nocardia transvalensis]
MNRTDTVHIDWAVPGTGLDALFGDGATRAEKILPTVIGLIGTALVVGHAMAAGFDWSWWRYSVAAILAADLVGGVVANALNSAKRFQNADHIAVRRPTAALVRNHPLFTAVHIHPIVIALLFPGPGLAWGLLWYAITLASVLIVGHTPLYLRRPAAMATVAVAPVLAASMDNPQGFAWLPSILAAKLVLGAVREEPYRPAAGS